MPRLDFTQGLTAAPSGILGSWSPLSIAAGRANGLRWRPPTSRWGGLPGAKPRPAFSFFAPRAVRIASSRTAVASLACLASLALPACCSAPSHATPMRATLRCTTPHRVVLYPMPVPRSASLPNSLAQTLAKSCFKGVKVPRWAPRELDPAIY